MPDDKDSQLILTKDQLLGCIERATNRVIVKGVKFDEAYDAEVDALLKRLRPAPRDAKTKSRFIDRNWQDKEELDG